MNGFFFRNNKHNVSNVSAEWWCNHTLYGKPRASFKHHATFLTVRSPTAVSSEPWGEVFYLSSKQFFKKITVKYIIYNEIVLLPLGGGIFYYHGTRQSWLKILDKWVSCYQIVRLLFCLNTKNPKPRDIVLKNCYCFLLMFNCRKYNVIKTSQTGQSSVEIFSSSLELKDCFVFFLKQLDKAASNSCATNNAVISLYGKSWHNTLYVNCSVYTQWSHEKRRSTIFHRPGRNVCLFWLKYFGGN